MFYTLGQRQGLKIGGQKNISIDGAPWYVVAKNLLSNTLIVAQGQENPLLYTHTLLAKNVHWINSEPKSFPFKLHAKTRYRQIEQECIITHVEQDLFKITFTNAQRAITPGQSVVFYQNETFLGGGIIV